MIPEHQNNQQIERQIVELQSKLAYQEDTVQALNDIVSEQQKDILHLQDQMKALVQELRVVLEDLQPDNPAAPASERPPHY